MATKTADQSELLKQLDSSKITKLHWKIMLISGMGFFTDAYDLFIIGVVMAILKNEWRPTATETGWYLDITSRRGDRRGRKRFFA